MKPPIYLWLLFDLDNGDETKGIYYWRFSTRSKAREHIKEQASRLHPARLSRPYKYRLSEEE